ncbi:hypothetical protein GCM10009678_37060 [Actinomadura kijaniata]|uniref:DUF3558 domain-containing protein n=1 Tax=Actinomadura namibiensis TaxID=182080 RepID=A0A7W3QRT6_ACTNM|nr:hypothetical protein [Actinomadura namibiensis]MBA8957130.1 hypothetical protein [Actinomadura namibiensis]
MQQGRSPWSDPAYERPKRPRSRRRAAVVAAALLTLLALGAALVVAAVRVDREDRRGKERPPVPRAQLPSPEAGPYTKILDDDACALVPDALPKRLALRAAPKSGLESSGWVCEWSSTRTEGSVRTTRDAKIEISLAGPQSGEPGTVWATRRFAQQRDGARAPDRRFEIAEVEHGPVQDLTGVGHAAFTGYELSKGVGLGPTGTATAVARLDNAIVKAEYGGRTVRLDGLGLPDAGTARPVTDAAARRPATELLRTAVTALRSCRGCLT